MCGYALFGPDHLLFGTDMPYDGQLGDRIVRNTIESVDRMAIDEGEKRQIYSDNARRLCNL